MTTKDCGWTFLIWAALLVLLVVVVSLAGCASTQMSEEVVPLRHPLFQEEFLYCPVGTRIGDVMTEQPGYFMTFRVAEVLANSDVKEMPEIE